jgi:hypothetical protein
VCVSRNGRGGGQNVVFLNKNNVCETHFAAAFLNYTLAPRVRHFKARADAFSWELGSKNFSDQRFANAIMQKLIV